MIALAAFIADPPCKLATATGTTSSASSLAGKRHPITPVEEGKTVLAPPGRLRALATASQTSSESATPSPPEHTFETLLLITRACRGPPAASRDLPTIMGAPGNWMKADNYDAVS